MAAASRARQEARPPSRSVARDRLLRAKAAKARERLRIRREIRADQELAAFIASVTVPMAAELWAPPLRAAYRITATFGQAGSLWSRDHTGVDLAAPTGTPVVAVAAGTVTHAGTDGSYGLKVEITHEDGSATWYAHMSRLDVTVGEIVQSGVSIGAVGATGNVTGPHLHLELRPDGGGPVDPVQGLAGRGVAL